MTAALSIAQVGKVLLLDLQHELAAHRCFTPVPFVVENLKVEYRNLILSLLAFGTKTNEILIR